MTVAVLFARTDSNYKALPGCDVYDIERDARRFPGGSPVVAHPICGPWGRLAQFCNATPEEKATGPWAVNVVRKWGGILEHPAASKLWDACGMPRPGKSPDAWGGYTIEVRQCDWGHKAEKLTWLYIVGCSPDSLPDFPPPGQPTGVIKPRRGVPRTLKIVTKAEREHTPLPFCKFLVETARKCRRGC